MGTANTSNVQKTPCSRRTCSPSKTASKLAGFTILLVSSVPALAAGPTTQPAAKLPDEPAVPISRPPLVDSRRPAFVPKFAQVNNPPAGHFAERQYQYQLTFPAPCYYGYGGCYGYLGWSGGFGCGGGSWGSTQVSFR